MKTSSAKAKGRRLQQLVRDRILDLYPELEADDVRSCPMGSNGEDIQLSPAARRLFPWSIECKARAKASIQSDYDQAARNAPKGSSPALVTKVDRRDPTVTISMDDFIRLVENQK